MWPTLKDWRSRPGAPRFVDREPIVEDTRPVPNTPQVPPERPWSLRARVTLVLGVAVVLPILGSAVYFTGRKQAAREFEARQRTAELAARSEKLSAANTQLEKLANSDALTGIANRRAVMEAIDLAMRSAARSHSPVSILAVAVDHFKAYNDAFGHPAGDECLKRVAQALEGMARRPLDRAGRTGGEEFVVVLHDAPSGAALRIGEKLRGAVESLGISHPGSPSGRVTVSVGVATIEPTADTVSSDVLDHAGGRGLVSGQAHGTQSRAGRREVSSSRSRG